MAKEIFISYSRKDFDKVHDKLMEGLHKRFQNSTHREKSTRELAEEGDAEAQFNKGCLYYSEGDFLEASKWFLKAANQGHVSSQYYLGLFYEDGKGVQQDHIQAVYWYRKAAEQGDANAIKWLKARNIDY